MLQNNSTLLTIFFRTTEIFASLPIYLAECF
jgi:hypothetical protein